jgi:hypothetical protein
MMPRGMRFALISQKSMTKKGFEFKNQVNGNPAELKGCVHVFAERKTPTPQNQSGIACHHRDRSWVY